MYLLGVTSDLRSKPATEKVHMRTAQKIGVSTALTSAGVLVIGILAAPAASAAPVTAATFTPLLGLAGTSSGSSDVTGPVTEDIRVTTDPDEPGVSRFSGSVFCTCQVNWRNLDTGATGSAPGGGPFIVGGPSPYVAVTGPGTIVATAVVSTGVTLLPGNATWHVQ